ncbi:MAG: hypothetical protein JW821_02235 [Deltaproteobacteria bacterium]|nr:hypothetical protein [Deltaproteobacteria bacterium]
METIAVYWEARVKTYGFQEERDLALVQVSIEQSLLDEWGLVLDGLGDRDIPFVLVLMQPSQDGRLDFRFLLKREWEGPFLDHLAGFLRGRGKECVRVAAPVEMIHFQGPHFGDRYGIVDAAFRALIRGNVPVLAVSCSGASVYLILPEKEARTALPLLEEAFEVPRRRPRFQT